MIDRHAIRLRVNGREHAPTVESRRTLADVLRHDLGYTGTHLGCEHGICGACTVLVDGAPALPDVRRAGRRLRGHHGGRPGRR
jgi:carbon-monoxide dehydrogenase small subunit